MRQLLLLPLCAAAVFAAGALSNRRAPSFSLPDVTGKQYDILDYRGRVLILDIMKTSCPHCELMTSVLEEIKKKHGERVAVLSVVNFPEDNPQTAAQYAKARKMATPILFDCGSVAAAYLQANSFDTPHVFLIDARGTIRNDFTYAPDTQQFFEGTALMAEVEKLLASSSAPAAKKGAR